MTASIIVTIVINCYEYLLGLESCLDIVLSLDKPVAVPWPETRHRHTGGDLCSVLFELNYTVRASNLSSERNKTNKCPERGNNHSENRNQTVNRFANHFCKPFHQAFCRPLQPFRQVLPPTFPLSSVETPHSFVALSEAVRGFPPKFREALRRRRAAGPELLRRRLPYTPRPLGWLRPGLAGPVEGEIFGTRHRWRTDRVGEGGEVALKNELITVYRYTHTFSWGSKMLHVRNILVGALNPSPVLWSINISGRKLN